MSPAKEEKNVVADLAKQYGVPVGTVGTIFAVFAVAAHFGLFKSPEQLASERVEGEKYRMEVSQQLADINRTLTEVRKDVLLIREESMSDAEFRLWVFQMQNANQPSGIKWIDPNKVQGGD